MGEKTVKKINRLLLLTIFLLFILWLLLQPKISSRIPLLKFKKDHRLEQFIGNSEKNQTIDPQKYWELREFYSPGYFVFKRGGLKKEEITEKLEEVNVPITAENLTFSFLTFNSPKWNSLEALVEKSSLHDYVKEDKLIGKEILVNNERLLIYNEGPVIKIIFLLPMDPMENANGFFDYREVDHQLVKNKYWLNLTKIDKK